MMNATEYFIWLIFFSSRWGTVVNSHMGKLGSVPMETQSSRLWHQIADGTIGRRRTSRASFPG